MMRQGRFEEECAVLRRSVLRSVEERDEFALEQGLEVYERLVRRFIRKLGDLGVAYDQQSARREVSGSIRGGWPQLEWIRDDYVTILGTALRSSDFGIIRRALYFPFSIARTALDAQDYLSFYYFLELPVVAYNLAEELPPSQLKTRIVERLARYPREFTDYHLTIRLGESETEADIWWVRQMSEGVIGIYNGLLKSAVDALDSASFTDLLVHLNQLFRHYDDSIPGFQDWQESPEGDVRPNSGPLPLFTQLASTLSALESLRNITKLGIAAWTARCVQVRQSASHLDTVLPLLGFDGDLEKLSRTWIAASEERYEALLRWSWWSIEGKQEGVVHWGGFDQYLNTAYVVFALRTVKSDGPPQAIDAFSATDTYALDENGALHSALTDIGNHADLWRGLVPEDLLGRSEALRRIFRATVEHRRGVREKQVVAAALSTTRIELFAAAEARGYEVLPDFLRLVQATGAVRQVPASLLEGNQWGYNELLPKEWFIDDTHVAIDHLGKQHGQDLRAGLTGHILKELLAGLPTEGLRDEPLVSNQIHQHVSALRDRGGTPVVLVVGSLHLIQRLRSDPAFSPNNAAWGRGPDVAMGVLAGADVHRLLARDIEAIAVCDLARVGAWEQGIPGGGDPEERILAGEVRFRLRELDEDELVRLASERQARLRKDDPAGRVESMEQATWNLRQRVVHRLLTSARFAIEDASWGMVLRGPERGDAGSDDE